MKVILIYLQGDQYDHDTVIEKFESEEEMIKFINERNIGKDVVAAYGVYKEIEIEPFDKVVSYRIKDN